jgi:hypothetical protein
MPGAKSKILLLIFTVFTVILISAGMIFQKNSSNEKTDERETVTENTDSTGEEQDGPADTVKIGAYIFSVYDLDFPGNKVNIDFYLWYNSLKDSINMLEYLEIINSSGYNKTAETNEKRDGSVYQTVRINSTIKQEWDVTHFPFDRQKIEIHIEDYDKDNSKLVLIADTLASKIDKDVKLEGWKIKDFGIKTVDHTYETNYGDPEIPLDEFSSYSRAIVFFTLEREGKGLFFKLFIGLFISVLISLLTFFVNPLDLDPRFGLSVGAIFAAIASQYVITSTLPQNESLTLVDILHDISFIYIFMCILISTISLHLMKTGQAERSGKLDRYSLYIFSASYIILVSFFVIRTLG